MVRYLLTLAVKTACWPVTVHRWLNEPIEGEGWPTFIEWGR